MRLAGVGVAARPAAGEHVCGDAHVIAPFEGGVLFAAIDGLGHGAEAAQAAKGAVAVLEGQRGRPAVELLRQCHAALKKTRGAALSVASVSFSAATMEWVAVGNVEAMLVKGDGRGREHVFLRGGIVGHQLPTPRAAELHVDAGDLLVFATDGIRHGTIAAIDLLADPSLVARRMLEQGAVEHDDALVLVARFAEGQE